METGGGNNWRPPQQQQPQQKQGESSLSVAMEAAASNHEWRSQLPPEARQRIVSKIMDTLKRHLPISAPEGLGELQKIAVRFEEKIFNAATNQTDYLRKISMKMLTMEQKNPNPTVSNPASTNSNMLAQGSPDAAANVVQVRNQVPSIPMSTSTQPQAKQILAPNVASSIVPAALETGQGVAGNLYASQQQRRQFQQPIVSQQQQQQSQNQLAYQQQQFTKQNISSSLLQPSISQQQKSQLMHATLQSQQTMAMPSSLQQSQTSLPNKQSSVLQPVPQNMQHSQQGPIQQGGSSMYHPSALRQPSMSQKSTLQPQSLSLSQQSAAQQQMLNQRAFAPNILPELQQQRLQQHSGLANQQNTLLNMPRAMNQKNITMHPQQTLVTQSSLSGLLPQHQQQPPSQQISSHQTQVLSSQSNTTNLQQHPQTGNMLQQSKPAGQIPQSSSGLLQLQGAQASQQQHMPQLQPQSIHVQQPLATQQREMHQRHQAPGTILQTPNVIDQQKQQIQTQRVLAEAPSMSVDSTAQATHIGADVQEEVYQKIKSMKEIYSPVLHDMKHKMELKLKQNEGLVLPPKQSEQLENMKKYKIMIERMLNVLNAQKNGVTAAFMEKFPYWEKQIINCVNNHRKKHASLAQGQQFQHPSTISQPMQQQSSQVTQLQKMDVLTNPAQQMSMPMSVASVQSTAVSNIQSGSIPPTTLVGAHSNTQNIEATQGNALNSLQHGNLGTLHQAPINAQQQNSINTLMHNTGSTMPSTVNPLQQNSNVLQHQQMKQEHQSLMQAQQIKQRQLQMIQQQKQHILQQQSQPQQPLLQQKQLQQQASQVPPNQIQQLNQMSEMNARNVMKPGIFQSHNQAGQRQQAYYQQQLKSSSPFSPQAPSPLMPQHSSPQVEQQALPSHHKSGTPIQSSTPPFVVPSPSTPLAPSPLPGDHEKQPSSIPSHAGAGNASQQQLVHGQAQVQSLAVGTPGISASPLLAELESLAPNASAVPGKSSSAEQPIERLIKAVKSSSRAALCSAVNDIGSVVSMMDRIAGSAPGFGSKMAVGEDLAAMTRCRLQAKNFMSQDGSATTRKMKRHIVAMPFDALPSASSVNESCKRSLAVDTSDELSTSPDLKSLKVEVSHVLRDEIREINKQLIETVVDVVDDGTDGAAEGGEGTVVKFTFRAVALSPNLKSHLASANVSPIRPLHLRIPTKYPKFSPIVLDKMPAELSEGSEDLSAKTRSRFGISLQTLPETMSLKDMARAWDASAREVILQYAKRNGGGSFSSRYGTWEKCDYSTDPSCLGSKPCDESNHFNAQVTNKLCT